MEYFKKVIWILRFFKYDDNFIVKTIDNFDNVKMMFINLLSGDEMLNVIYNDRTIDAIYPNIETRFMNLTDHSYTIYDVTKSKNLIYNPIFMNRKKSFWIFDNPDIYNEFRIMM